MLWGKLIGWLEGFATAGRRLHDDTARKIRTARSATPSAPTPALAVIDSRLPPEGLKDACEPYHRLCGPSIHSRGSWWPKGDQPTVRAWAAARVEAPVARGLAARGGGRETRRDRQRIPRQRPGLIDVAERRHVAHQTPRPAVGAHRKPAPDDLAEARQVGADAVELLRAAVRDAEPRDALGEDEHAP